MNQQKRWTLAELQELLRKNSIRPSFQRLQILRLLAASHRHPTVDGIFRSLAREIPTLSRTTVYNTLKLMETKGIVRSLSIEGHEVRYDFALHHHSHFFCRLCRRIYDIDLDCQVSLPDSIDGHKIEDTRFFLSGTCSTCRRA